MVYTVLAYRGHSVGEHGVGLYSVKKIRSLNQKFYLRSPDEKLDQQFNIWLNRSVLNEQIKTPNTIVVDGHPTQAYSTMQ